MTPALHGALQVGRGLGHIYFRRYFHPHLRPCLPFAILLRCPRHDLLPLAEIPPFPHRAVRWRRGNAHPLAQRVLDMHISVRSLAVALSSLRSSSSCKIGPGPTSSRLDYPTNPKIARGRTVFLHLCHRGESEIVYLEPTMMHIRPFKCYTYLSWVKLRDEYEPDSSNGDHDGVKHWHDGFWTDIGT
jgi:hypothetical protein